MLWALPGAETLAARMHAHWRCEPGGLNLHRFPDGECCPVFDQPLVGREVVLTAVLGHPDASLFALYLCASVARELDARSVGLVLPYLPYMRQDARFTPGQGITSLHVAHLLGECADWLATVDPHLHRHLAARNIDLNSGSLKSYTYPQASLFRGRSLT
jgi:ribose-phosphate pyrophosphokinase